MVLKFTYYIYVFLSAEGTMGQFYAQADWLQRRSRDFWKAKETWQGVGGV